MRVTPTVVSGQKPEKRFLEIGLGTGMELDQCEASGGMGNEHMTETVPSAVTKLLHRRGEIDELPTNGIQLDDGSFHASRT